MKAANSLYKILRSVLFTTILVVIGIIALTYIIVSIPAVQTKFKNIAERELSSFFESKVEISELKIIPFNELRLYGVSLYQPNGKRCVSIGRLGAGINLFSLVFSERIEINYVEVISLNAVINQDVKDGPLNIDFIIKAFSPKDKNKPPAKFDLQLRNIVIRKSSLSFDRLYLPVKLQKDEIDFNHLEINNLRADLALPVLSNNDFIIDLRRLAFDEKSGLNINNISFLAHLTPEFLELKNSNITVGNSKLKISDENIKIDGFNHILNSFYDNIIPLSIEISPLIPSDFAPFFIQLNKFSDNCSFSLNGRGNLEHFNIEKLIFKDNQNESSLDLSADLNMGKTSDEFSGIVNLLKIDFSTSFIRAIVSEIDKISDSIKEKLFYLGNVKSEFSGQFDLSKRNLDLSGEILCDAGEVETESYFDWSKDNLFSKFSLSGKDISIGKLTGNDYLNYITFSSEGNLAYGKDSFDLDIDLEIPYVDINSHKIENIFIKGSKTGNEIIGNIIADDNVLNFNLDGKYLIDGINSNLSLYADVSKFIPSVFIRKNHNLPNDVSFKLSSDLSGNSVDNIIGDISIDDLKINGKKNFEIKNLKLSSTVSDSIRDYILTSDYLTAEFKGEFIPSQIISNIKNLIAETIPVFVKPGEFYDCTNQKMKFQLALNPDDKILKLLNLPLKPVEDIVINGSFSGDENVFDINSEIPYFVMGKNKLIKNSSFSLNLKKGCDSKINLISTIPIKNEWAQINLLLGGLHDTFNIDLNWLQPSNPLNHGQVELSAYLKRNNLTGSLDITGIINPSEFILKDSKWNISKAGIYYSSKNLTVDNLSITNGLQYIDIQGKASDSPFDVLNVSLAGIDLEYIFNLLNINYVDFGGIATGRAYFTNLFTKNPIAATEHLKVENLSYFGCVLGDGDIEGHWDNKDQKVVINADVSNAGEDIVATVRGEVFVTRDSLSFDFDANKVNVEFLKPFVNGFTSEISGKGSGHVKMFGTFSDIDLVGKAYADSVTMLVDYTNVYYTGCDTVYFKPGMISIPNMTVFDRYGNTCKVNGEIKHRYLHDPTFVFDVSEIEHLLVYDTNPKINPEWYGHVYADGSAVIRGVPGLVTINMNLRTADNSSFTLVLDENETALNYSFLTFSDKRKDAIEKLVVEESFEDKFFKDRNQEKRERPTMFAMDLALEVNTGATMIIIMDPKAGDKITARGQGPLQFHYDTETDRFNMYGKYTLANGNYNFSLQDLILKNFNILEGSSITFNGDPLRGILDITAAYRINANLAELDDSFKYDLDLNRTTVPVEALLKVSGEIDSPEIKFDLSLPTVTSDVERRVRSIVSTEDMMNQQIIYLLALNRFYSPDYTSSSQGGELATIASSTISSQIQNIIGSMTNKFSLSPSFKSDKNNFSDMEVDVALSSSLFDDRLLINGNLGYRDKSTSNSTFIGDFDIEYLLSKDGKFRLKAYNHFNDASYYLKSALTTQGIGLVYRRDFDDPFSFLKRWFRYKKVSKSTESNDKK